MHEIESFFASKKCANKEFNLNKYAKIKFAVGSFFKTAYT